MGGEISEPACSLGIVEREGPHIEASAIALAQEDYILAVTAYHGVTVLAVAVSEIGVGAVSGIIEPEVTGGRRSVMLAHIILHTHLVHVHKRAAVRQIGYLRGGAAQKLNGTTALDGHRVDLAVASAGEKSARCGELNVSRIDDTLTVGAECHGRFACRIEGESLGFAAGGGHHIDIESAFAVAAECYAGAVGAPHGSGFISRRCGEARSLAAGSGHGVDVACVSKGYALAVGRDFHISHPQRCGGLESQTGTYKCQGCKKFFHHIYHIIFITYLSCKE